jgi:hypothetical protein
VFDIIHQGKGHAQKRPLPAIITDTVTDKRQANARFGVRLPYPPLHQLPNPLSHLSSSRAQPLRGLEADA